MTVTYLDHSGFAVTCNDRMLVFDYYKGELPELDGIEKIYVFSSHGHYDHFQKKIFDWAKDYDVTYILSDDIHAKGPKERIIHVGPNERIPVDAMEIKTLRSTDEGVAFFVHLRGRNIYHAGDLNWWHWEEESKAYNEMKKRNYQYEIGKIAGESIDLAFVPLDPRQGEQYYWGMDYFMRHTDTKAVFPMHMWEKYEVYDWLMKNPEAVSYKRKVMHVTKQQQRFEIV